MEKKKKKKEKKKPSLFPEGPVIKCVVITSRLKNRIKLRNNDLVDARIDSWFDLVDARWLLMKSSVW